MISLYESILKSVGSGKEKLAEPVRKWFYTCSDFNMKLRGILKDEDIQLEPYKDMWKIYLKMDSPIQSWQFDKADSKGTGVLPYKIYAIYVNNKPIMMSYMNLDFDSSDDFVQEVDENLTFYGCKIKKIDKLPKGIKSVHFTYGHVLGGGHPCSVEEISKINVDFFETSSAATSRMGLSCRLSRINGITVNSRFEICDSMLGYYSLEKGNRIFKQDASDMLNEFFKNNKVKPEQCMFNSEDGKLGSIEFDKKINRWRFKLYPNSKKIKL